MLTQPRAAGRVVEQGCDAAREEADPTCRPTGPPEPGGGQGREEAAAMVPAQMWGSTDRRLSLIHI